MLATSGFQGDMKALQKNLAARHLVSDEKFLNFLIDRFYGADVHCFSFLCSVLCYLIWYLVLTNHVRLNFSYTISLIEPISIEILVMSGNLYIKSLPKLLSSIYFIGKQCERETLDVAFSLLFTWLVSLRLCLL